MRLREIDPRDRLRQFVAEHTYQQNAAAALGVSPSFLSDLLRGRRTFSPRMLAALGLRTTTVQANQR